MGFVIVVALGLYVLISMGVVAWAVSYAKKNDKSAKRWGWGAALGMYLLVFWDWIPTVATHQYYCATQAGFWVYRTPEQWKAENPGVMETLVANNSSIQRVGDDMNFIDTYFLNQRINKVVQEHRVFLALPVFRHEQDVVDIKNNQTLVRYVDFRAGYPSGLAGILPKGAGMASMKFWLANGNCRSGERNYGNFLLVKRAFQGEEK